MNAAALPLQPASESHLRLLAIFHYLFAGFGLLGLGFLGLHYAFMQNIVAMAERSPGGNPPPAGFLDLFIWFYVLMGLLCLAGAALNVLAARSLQTRRRWMLCAIVAGLNCLQVPLGTVLGVFTLVVLNRPDVRPAFR